MVVGSSRAAGRAAVGLAVCAALVATPCVVFASSATAATTTTLTSAQSRTVLSSVLAASEAHALRDGLRLTTTAGYVTGDPVGWRDVLTLDPSRGTAELTADARGYAPPYTSESPNPCIPDGSADRHGRWIWKAGEGRWNRLRLDTDNYERAGSKLAGSPHALWTRRSLPHTSLKNVLASFGLRQDLGKDSDTATLTNGGTATPTATGTRYVITYRQRGDKTDTGALTLDVGAGDVLIRATLRIAPVDGVPAFAISYAASYGSQHVVAPRSRVMASPKFVAGCRAAFARAYPQKLAKQVALIVNILDKGESNKTIIGDIRLDARILNDASRYGVDVKVRKIRHGIRITGRDKLLKHPYVSTVFIRNGKAVAHRVR